MLDRLTARGNDEYGILAFASDHGLIQRTNNYYNGDSGIYPGSGSDLNANNERAQGHPLRDRDPQQPQPRQHARLLRHRRELDLGAPQRLLQQRHRDRDRLAVPRPPGPAPGPRPLELQRDLLQQRELLHEVRRHRASATSRWRSAATSTAPSARCPDPGRHRRADRRRQLQLAPTTTGSTTTGATAPCSSGCRPRCATSSTRPSSSTPPTTTTRPTTTWASRPGRQGPRTTAWTTGGTTQGDGNCWEDNPYSRGERDRQLHRCRRAACADGGSIFTPGLPGEGRRVPHLQPVRPQRPDLPAPAAAATGSTARASPTRPGRPPAPSVRRRTPRPCWRRHWWRSPGCCSSSASAAGGEGAGAA